MQRRPIERTPEVRAHLRRLLAVKVLAVSVALLCGWIAERMSGPIIGVIVASVIAISILMVYLAFVARPPR